VTQLEKLGFEAKLTPSPKLLETHDGVTTRTSSDFSI
jgi:hypothetical protein